MSVRNEILRISGAPLLLRSMGTSSAGKFATWPAHQFGQPRSVDRLFLIPHPQHDVDLLIAQTVRRAGVAGQHAETARDVDLARWIAPRAWPRRALGQRGVGQILRSDVVVGVVQDQVHTVAVRSAGLDREIKAAEELVIDLRTLRGVAGTGTHGGTTRVATHSVGDGISTPRGRGARRGRQHPRAFAGRGESSDDPLSDRAPCR